MFFAVILGLLYAILFLVDSEWGQFTDADSLRFKELLKHTYSSMELCEAMLNLRDEHGGKFTPEDVDKITGRRISQRVARRVKSGSSGVKHRESNVAPSSSEVAPSSRGAAGGRSEEVACGGGTLADCVSNHAAEEAISSGWVTAAIEREEEAEASSAARCEPDGGEVMSVSDDGDDLPHNDDFDEPDWSIDDDADAHTDSSDDYVAEPERDDGYNHNHDIEHTSDQTMEKCVLPRPIVPQDCCSLILTGLIGVTLFSFL